MDLKHWRDQVSDLVGFKLTQAGAAALFNTPYRTYQDWEADKARVPGIMDPSTRLILGMIRAGHITLGKADGEVYMVAGGTNDTDTDK